MKTRKVSLIIFYTKDKKILLQDRSFKNNPDVEWGFFGGEIDNGETPEDALIRETKEELTYDLKDYKYIGNYIGYNKKQDLEIEGFIYISPLIDINKFDQKEGDKMGLFTIEEAKNLKMLEGFDYQILDMIEKKLG